MFNGKYEKRLAKFFSEETSVVMLHPAGSGKVKEDEPILYIDEASDESMKEAISQAAHTHEMALPRCVSK